MENLKDIQFMVLVILLYLFFASTFTLGKAALTYVSPLLFIGCRMILGGSILLSYLLYKNRLRVHIKAKDYSLFARIILFHIFLAYTLEFWALEHITSAKACLLYNLSPFITAIFAFFLYHERLSMRQLCGLIIGFLGFLPILIAQTPLEEMGKHIGFFSVYEIALIVSVASSAYGWIIMKKLTQEGYSFIFVNSIGMLGGGVLAFITSLYIEGIPSLKIAPIVLHSIEPYVGTTGESLIVLSFYSILLVLIANIIGYNLYGYLLSRYSPTFLSFAGFMTPLFAALLGWIFLGEAVSWHFFATMVCIVIGLYLFYDKHDLIPDK